MNAHLREPRGFAHVETWIFDLDNTLYPPSSQLFDLIDQRMTLYVADRFGLDGISARAMQKHFYRKFGTTMSGLMQTENIDPHEFMDFVHDVSHERLIPDPALKQAIEQLPGKRYILTNGSRRHAERVAHSIGLADLFHDVFDIAAANFVPKPAQQAYDIFVERFGVDPGRAAMFEDLARNLLVPHALGMTTTLVLPRGADADERMAHVDDGTKGPHVDHATDDLAGFLHGILRERQGAL